MSEGAERHPFLAREAALSLPRMSFKELPKHLPCFLSARESRHSAVPKPQSTQKSHKSTKYRTLSTRKSRYSAVPKPQSTRKSYAKAPKVP